MAHLLISLYFRSYQTVVRSQDADVYARLVSERHDDYNKHLEEVGVVDSADAVVEPLAVVVEVAHAPVAGRAVLRELKHVSVANIAEVIVLIRVEGSEFFPGNALDPEVLDVFSMLFVESVLVNSPISGIAPCSYVSVVEHQKSKDDVANSKHYRLRGLVS